MITLVKGTQHYGAEIQLQRLMKEQHIDDPEMVADIEWFGWQRKKTVDRSAFSYLPSLSWNVALTLTSLLSSLVSVSPYLYLIHNSWGRATLWLFPLLRSFGALLCVVSVQLALQIRIHRITTTSLLLMKARRRSPLPAEEAIKDKEMLLESRLRNLRAQLGRRSDPEQQLASEAGDQTDIQDEAEARSRTQDVLLLLLQAILVVGMGMIIAGYVGCFNMVGRTNVDGGPYVWSGMETILAVLRIGLWGWNPLWDEGSTGMTIRLALRPRDLISDAKTSISPANPAQKAFRPHDPPEGSDPDISDLRLSPFPLITSPQFLSQFTMTAMFAGTWRQDEKDSLIVENIEEFLAAATPYIGPLRRLELEELKDILLYCGIVPNGDRKLLCMTACRNDSRWASVTIFVDGGTPYATYISRSRDLPGTRALRVTLENEVQSDSVAVVDQRTLDLLIDYSYRLFSRLCSVDTSINQLPLSWTITLPPLPNSENMRQSILLTEQDKAYIRTRQIQNLKGDYCMMRGDLLLGVFPLNWTAKWHDEMVEWALLLESAVMEAYLCILDHQFVQSTSLSPTHSRRIALEWVRSMEDRILSEKEGCRRRRRAADPTLFFRYETTYDLLVRELRSLRQLPIGSTVLESWKGLIATIMDQPNELPAIPRLFKLPPIQRLENLSHFLLPRFAMDSPCESNVPTWMYHNMIASLRSSLYRLRDARASSFRDII
ncbi:hypothetical protein AAF712_016597 [Marasmius tenuissimus]|uniref:Uncharacterized protein n=1 Tax=Marasmius tenuissimus TaxID=585030 RepID=A0ABR2Z5D8_9AGAR